MTKIYDFKKNINKKELKYIGETLQNGELVIFPTETVYGIGANALDENAVKKIFQAKGRAIDNPLIVHVSSIEMIEKTVIHITDIEKKLIKSFMPGPFTLILPKNNIIPNVVSANLDTVGIRWPENEIAQKIIEVAKVPIAAPSANISSRPSGTNIEDIYEEFNNKVSIIIDGGETEIGLESTVLKVIDDIPTILRPGKITKEDVIKAVGICEYSKNINVIDSKKIESPGMKYKHYAPRTKALLIYSKDDNKIITEINRVKTDKTIIIGPLELESEFKNYLSYGSKKDLNAISHNLFSVIRKADKKNADLIIIIGVKNEGLGVAVMNRLLRSVGFNYIEN